MMIKKKTCRKVILFMMIIMIIASLTGCGKSGNYQAYVKSIMSANYLGIYGDYVRLTGEDEEVAESLYLQNVTRFANNLSGYYGLDISSNEQLAPAMVELAKQIYSKTKFDVGKAYKDNNINYVDVTIYPIDILNQSDAEVRAYIEKFNAAVDAGDYNNFTKDEYEYEFATGIIGILAETAKNITYAEPQVVKVRIITADDTYYIGNEDFRNLDAAVISTAIQESPVSDDQEAATSGDAETEGESE